MLKVGDKVKYRDLVGEIKSVLDDMVIVRLPDGKDYSLPYNAVSIDGDPVVAPSDMRGIMQALRPYLKNMTFLNDLAKAMGDSGIGELHVKGGSIHAFNAKESLDERRARYHAEALAEADRKALEDHQRENEVKQ